MNYRAGVLTGATTALLVAGAAAAGWWLWSANPAGTAKGSPPPVPATVPKVLKEDAVNAVTLTADAEARLALKTAPVERKPVGRVRVYGGEVAIPPGRAVIVSAPLAGTLKPSGEAPVAGQAVTKGQALFQLLPILDPVGQANLTASRVDADGQVQNAAEQMKAAQQTLDRAKRVKDTGGGRQRDVDDAQAALDIASQLKAAAVARRDLLARVVGDLESGATNPVPVEVPEDGVLRAVSALPGQKVPAGAALFEVVDLSTVWVRVPVYVGDLADIDPAAPAAVGTLTARPGQPTRPAAPVAAPPAANPAAGTADLVYALDNREARYAPGQRVGASLALKGPADGLTVPASAVVYDLHGGGWVYERTGDRAYTRRRVGVRSVVGDTAVLDAGPPAGAVVVAAGAAELFGTETGFSK